MASYGKKNQNLAMKYGISAEYSAKKKYEKVIKISKEHTNLKIGHPRLHVLPTHPYIGASSDRILFHYFSHLGQQF